MEEFVFERDPAEEHEADNRAVELLEHSPYSDKLGNAGLFLKALALRSDTLPALIRPHFGNRMANNEQVVRMPRIVSAAPELDPTALDQIAALPLGGRVKVDPWSASVELMKNNRVTLLSAREKMPFLITPLMPHLARHDASRDGEQAAAERQGTDPIARSEVGRTSDNEATARTRARNESR